MDTSMRGEEEEQFGLWWYECKCDVGGSRGWGG